MSKPCSHHGINILKTSPQIPPKPRGESKQNSVLPYLSQQAILHPGNNLSVFESHSLLHSGWDIVSRTVDINVGVNGCLCVYVWPSAGLAVRPGCMLILPRDPEI